MFRGSIGLVIGIIGAAIGIGFAVVRYNVLDAVLPTEFLAALDSARAGADDAPGVGDGNAKRVIVASAQDGAQQYLIDGPDGLRAKGPIAAMPGNRPVFIKDVIDGHATQVASDTPAELTTIRPISGCKLTPPLEESEVGHVSAGASGLGLPILTYDDSDLAGAVQGLVNLYRETGAADVVPPADLAYEVYDVAVTETRAPVYLVLESFVRNRIWNVHLAPGARVERVVLLGGAHSGVANLDPVVPVEALPADALSACGVQPAYPMNRGNGIFKVLGTGSAEEKAQAEAEIAAVADSVAAYNTWFRDSFGVDAEASRAGFDAGMVSVVGPLPGSGDPKAVYAAIQGARIRLTQDRYFEIVGQSTEADSFAGRVRAIATTFAFGDLSSLRQGVSF